MIYHASCIIAAFSLFAFDSFCQKALPGYPTQPGIVSTNVSPVESKRILGLVPNYRTSPSLQNYEPMTNVQKFKIASQDAFDRGTVGLAALFPGEGQFA